jgi:hypothetical protein
MGSVRKIPVSPEACARLEPLVGEWQLEGRQLASPFGPDATFSAHERYEWLAGHAFLVHHLEGKIGDADAACVEILGPREGQGGLAAHTFYDNGVQNLWDLESAGDGWVMRGTWPTPEGDAQVRCTIRREGTGRADLWEFSRDGRTWRTFLDVKARPA